MSERKNYMFEALAASSRANDIGQDATETSAIGLCRAAMKKGWRYPCDSKAFESLTLEETRVIFDLIESRCTYADLYSAINGILRNRLKIREIEESEGPSNE